MREALDSPGIAAHAKCAALLLSFVAHLAYRLDHYAEAERDAARALAAARSAFTEEAELQAVTVARVVLLPPEAGWPRRRSLYTTALHLTQASGNRARPRRCSRTWRSSRRPRATTTRR
jgi:hypothetical protein